MTIYKCEICNSIFSTIQATNNRKKRHKELLMDNSGAESDLEMSSSVDVESNGDVESIIILLITYSESDTEFAIECNYKDVFTNQEESLKPYGNLFKFSWVVQHKLSNSIQISDNYNEQWSGTWWKVASSTILYESKLLSIIIYSDATNCDNLGKTMKHPIYITLGNIPVCLRNKPESKTLIAYLLILKTTTISEKSSAVFKSAQRLAFMKSLKILFDPIYKQYEDGTILKINKSHIWCVLKLPFIISDLPEASAFCTTYKSYNSKLPCHTCLVEKENLSNMNLSSKIFYYKHQITRNKSYEMGMIKPTQSIQ
nr:4920_t:CDS:2 [Entrophospora candida]